MPRDLEALAKESKAQQQDDRLLTKSPEEVEGDQDRFQPARANINNNNVMSNQGKTFAQMRGGMSKRDQLHPYTNALSPKDAESCTSLEEQAFPANERCSKEKVSSVLAFFCFSSSKLFHVFLLCERNIYCVLAGLT